MRNLILSVPFVFVMAVCGGTARAADTAAPAARHHGITSLAKCMEQLPPADAADIRINYMMPYQECQKRLAAQIQAQNAETVRAAREGRLENTPTPADSTTAVTPRNYVRVKKTVTDSEKTTNKP